MKKIAIPQTLAGLMLHLIGDSMGLAPAGSGKGPGQRRAEESLKAKRKANAEMSKNWPERPMSRQVVRAAARHAVKIERHERKMAALKAKVPGGAAVVQ